MIKAFIFDLDGTLVQTESLKALSYARAAIKLCPESLTEEEVIKAFKDVVGLPRKEVAQKLLERFSLEKATRAHMAEFNVNRPWQAFVQIRMGIYESLVSDPKILRRHLCPYNAKLLRWARRNGYYTGLATMSHCPQASRVLGILHLTSNFDFIATIDDVENGKPDPEIYLLVSQELNVPPAECLVIEDSANGAQAALAADMAVITVTSEFTRQGVHESKLLDDSWVVDSPKELQAVVEKYLVELDTR